ncbi:MAG: hypothetical protein H6815_04820 [Phycisphaeraceae bacterium]|nr:hypothetical protein [Phycisphaerales bacterium]MCB9859757.1 hypothetical protein [Phycisphaeraceae bacterium]
MPANRSRTERWRECLLQLQQRGGSLELSFAQSRAPGDQPVAPGEDLSERSQPADIINALSRREDQPVSPGDDPSKRAQPADLIWRVRVCELLEGEIRVEVPVTLGKPMDIAKGVELVCAICIGQNRWMFRTSSLGDATVRDPRSGRSQRLIRLQMPEKVERCSRRSAHRVSTAQMNPAKVEMWPLLDPTSVVAAEHANRAQILSLEKQGAFAKDVTVAAEVLPDVGPKFMGSLVNIGGGGAGFLVTRDHAHGLDRARMFWVRMDLRPYIPVPLGATVKLAHTHIDSMQNVYAGVALDFTFNAEHRGFVAEQIERYVQELLKQQASMRAA